MKLFNILENNSGLLKSISINCQQFLEESGDMPLKKPCSMHWPDVHRIKVRKRKKIDSFVEDFNKAFEHVYPSILNRSVIINDSAKPDTDEFYLFPVDGYAIIANPTVRNSREQLSESLANINAGMVDGGEVIIEMLQSTYNVTSIKEALQDDVEIILYNIPIFYAVRNNLKYSNLLEMIK